MTCTFTSGHHFTNSRFQFFLRVLGQTTKAGNISSPESLNAFNARIAWAVLPRPGSSASNALRAVFKNATPALWCGNRSALERSSRVSRSRRLFAGVIRLASSPVAQSVNLGPIIRSFLKVDLNARHVAQLNGTVHTLSFVSHFAPGKLLQSSLKRHSALITTCLFVSSSSTFTDT